MPEFFRMIKDTNPILFGGIIGACAAMVVLFIAFAIYRGATERSNERASEIKESAYELVGREVIYERGLTKLRGTVYHVLYGIEDEAYKICLFVQVEELDRDIIIDYGRYYDKVKVVG